MGYSTLPVMKTAGFVNSDVGFDACPVPDRARAKSSISVFRRKARRTARRAGSDSGLDERDGLSYPAGMSKSARAEVGKGGLPFEEALKKLEGLVEAMESEDLPLEALLAKYEEGTRLVKICQEKLAEAELKIRQLEKNAAGEMKLKPFETDVET
jgi:exodeoxyribonuclease VII small subunit